MTRLLDESLLAYASRVAQQAGAGWQEIPPGPVAAVPEHARFCARAVSESPAPRCRLIEGHHGPCYGDLRADSWGLPPGVDAKAAAAARAVLRRQERAWQWRARVDPRFRDAELAAVEQPPAVMERVRAWLAAQSAAPGSLLLLGGVGAGKTWLATAVGRELFLQGQSVTVVTAAAMFVSLQPDGGARIEDYTRPEYLVLDDLGAERWSEFRDEVLFHIIDARWRRQLAIIITSNLDPAELAGKLGARVYDRLADGAVAVNVPGPSRRKRRSAA